MKKLLTALLTLLLIAGLSLPVFADVIYIPEDTFLNEHMMECTEVRRGFRALTDVTIYESPESNRVEGLIPQGKGIHVYYQYIDSSGNAWGYVEAHMEFWSEDGVFENGTRYAYGWIPMAYMELIYDHISFEEDYGHLFVEESGELDEAYVGQTIYFWNYPGDESGNQIPVEAYPPDYWHTYTDEAGRVWGYTGYYMGWKGYWFCIDDPTADFDTLFPEGAPQVEITEPGETEPTLPAEQIVPQPSAGTILLRTGVTVAVIACVIITVGILVGMKKKSE